MAKYVFDAKINMEDTWFNLADEEMVAPGAEKIPQLWNERACSQIQVSDGQLKEEEIRPSVRGVYGGVDFGLDRLQSVAQAQALGVIPPGRARMPTAHGIRFGARTDAQAWTMLGRRGDIAPGYDLKTAPALELGLPKAP